MQQNPLSANVNIPQKHARIVSRFLEEFKYYALCAQTFQLLLHKVAFVQVAPSPESWTMMTIGVNPPMSLSPSVVSSSRHYQVQVESRDPIIARDAHFFFSKEEMALKNIDDQILAPPPV